MSTQLEGQSIEAEIAMCVQAIYAATDAEIALARWKRMRALILQRTDGEDRQYLRESMRKGLDVR